MSYEKISGLVSLARKANKVISGETNLEALLPKKDVSLLIIAEDLSEKRKDSWKFEAANRNIDCIVIGTKIELGLSIGMSARSVIGITDDGFKKAILKKIE